METNVDQNQSPQSSQGGDLDDVLKLFNDYENKTENNSNPKQSKENILAKYFTPRNSVERFRILPPIQGRDIVEHAFFHRVPVNKPNGKGWRKIYCPAHNSPKVPKLDANGNPITDEQGKPVLVNQRCPLCEKADAIRSKIDNSIKYIKKENYNDAQKAIAEKNGEIYKELGKWEAKKYHIVRGIDRGSVKDGVKYWRFKDNYKNQGVRDKLIPALKLFYEQYKANPTDPEKGCDLYINVVDSRLPNGTTYKDVSSITAMQPSKLYEDPIVVNQWLSDNSTWRDVFREASMTKVINPTQYLERVAKGTDPYWDDRDEKNKKYVFPDPADADLQAKANERTESLDANGNGEVEMASDVAATSIVGSSYDVNINNVTTEDVGKDVDDSENVGAQFTPKETESAETKKEEKVVEQKQPTQPEKSVEEPVYQGEDDDDLSEYNDLPF